MQISIYYESNITANTTYANSYDLCKKLFSDNTYNMLGEASECILSKNMLKISLGDGNQIASKQVISFAK